MPTRITNVVARDIRFPTSRTLDGSDAMNPDPDYSAAYVILETDHPRGLEGHGFTFTIRRGARSGGGAVRRGDRFPGLSGARPHRRGGGGRSGRLLVPPDRRQPTALGRTRKR